MASIKVEENLNDDDNNNNHLNPIEECNDSLDFELDCTQHHIDTDGKNYHSSYLVYVAVLCAQMSSITMGCTFGWSSPALEDMDNWSESKFRPSGNQVNWIASTLLLGALFGAMVCGICMDIFGRKKTLIGIGIPYAIGWIMIGFTNSFVTILIGRLTTGLSLGITTAVLPTYVAEISTPNIRGLLGMSFNFFVVFGVVYMNIIYIFNFHWNQLALWALLPNGLLMITMFFMPESPSWCVNKIKDRNVGTERAIESLKRLRSTKSDITAELNALIENANRLNNTPQKKLKISLSTFARPDVYKPMLIGMMLLFFQQFCGINAVQFYQNELFEKAGTTLEPKYSSLISNMFMLGATVVGGFLIDRFGRKILYTASAIGLMISIGALGIYQYKNPEISSISTTTIKSVDFNTTFESTTILPSSNNSSILPIICVCAFVSSFSLGVGPICWIIITEITPPQTIGLISSTSSAFAWIFTFLVVNFTSHISDAITIHGTYWLFASLSLCSAIFIYFLPESKGKTMEQIMKIYKFDL